MVDIKTIKKGDRVKILTGYGIGSIGKVEAVRLSMGLIRVSYHDGKYETAFHPDSLEKVD
jgi:hypothetical protein